YLKHIGDRTHHYTGGNASVGASFTSNSATLGVMNNVTNEVRGIQIPYGKTPGRNLFEHNAQPEHVKHPNLNHEQEIPVDLDQLAETDAMLWRIVMENYPQPQHTPLTDWMDKEWQNLTEATFPKRDERYYVKDFARVYDQYGKKATANPQPSLSRTTQN